MKKVLFIVGSLRVQSFNKQLAQIAEKIVADRAQVGYLDWADVPLMNQDIELPTPEPVQRVRDEVTKADAIWVFSPEYNFNIPGGLKNLLDWLSRPVDPTDQQSVSVVKGKKAAISGVGGRAATAGMRAKMQELLGFMGADVVGGSGFGHALDSDAWVSNALLLDEDAQAELAALADLLFG